MPAVAVYKRVSDLVFMHSAAGVVIYIYIYTSTVATLVPCLKAILREQCGESHELFRLMCRARARTPLTDNAVLLFACHVSVCCVCVGGGGGYIRTW
jgi:hypothetical protein